jgi:hypothetical protein
MVSQPRPLIEVLAEMPDFRLSWGTRTVAETYVALARVGATGNKRVPLGVPCQRRLAEGPVVSIVEGSSARTA